MGRVANPSDEARFFAKVDAGSPDDCWLWTAGLMSKGYGSFWISGRSVLAHRWSFEFLRGEIPSDLHMDHLCRNRPCVNPWHLEPVSPRENTVRGEAPTIAAYRQHSCMQGHEIAPVDQSGQRRRQCPACKRDRYARYAGDPTWRAKRAAYERARRALTRQVTVEVKS